MAAKKKAAKKAAPRKKAAIKKKEGTSNAVSSVTNVLPVVEGQQAWERGEGVQTSPYDGE